MPTNGFENCIAGTFYVMSNTQNNEFHPGDTVQLQWGAFDNGNFPLNMSLARPGGALVDQIFVNATFTSTGALYQLHINTTANCTLEQYSWVIPTSFNTTNPNYQIGLFRAGDKLDTAGVGLFGWLAWSPDFYVREITTSGTVSEIMPKASVTGNYSSSTVLEMASTTSTTLILSSAAAQQQQQQQHPLHHLPAHLIQARLESALVSV